MDLATAKARCEVLDKQIDKFAKSGESRGAAAQTALFLAVSTCNRAKLMIESVEEDVNGFDNQPSKEELERAGFVQEAVIEAVKTSISEELAYANECLELAQRRFDDAQSKSEAAAS